MHVDLIIRNCLVVTPQGVQPLDLLIEAGRIVELSEGTRATAAREIDAAGLHVLPGVIDSHVHFNEPGRTDWEGFETGSAALAAGGGTCFFEMPLNASPPTLDGDSFDLKLAAARKNSRTDFALWGGLTPANLDKLDELADRGVIGFKAFMSNSGIDDFGRADDLTLYRGMKIAAGLGLPVAVHAESEELTSRLSAEAKAAGRTGIRDYLDSRPIIAEVDAIRRAIAFAFDTGCSLHIVHVSSPWGVQEVVEAQSSWARKWNHANAPTPTAETCPHYLTLTDADVLRLGAPAKCAPPVRTAAEAELMWAALAAGSFEFVASDHSPSPPGMKTDADFFKVWGGIAGVQSTLGTLLSRTPPLPLEQIAGLTAGHVARRFGIARKGVIAAGFDADLTLVDLSRSYTLNRDMLLDRHKLSPYVGRQFRGVVQQTLVRGQTVFENGRAVGTFRGELVQPARSQGCT